MRQTVDEKLHTTLEKRLTDSFGLVTEQLGRVQLGLGEMKDLANGVGDLKRVLTNVKTRGGFGEVQLGLLLDQMLSPEQYVTNARIREDYAIRMPGMRPSEYLGLKWQDIDWARQTVSVVRSIRRRAIPNVLEAGARLDCRVGLLLFSTNSRRRRFLPLRALRPLTWYSKRRRGSQSMPITLPSSSS